MWCVCDCGGGVDKVKRRRDIQAKKEQREREERSSLIDLSRTRQERKKES